jgi:uncharacterized PurR-regulated membrane protein YhhQ (DUF165 family)
MQILMILQLIFLILNILCAVWGYNKGNYKKAIVNGFCAGVLFDSLVKYITN